MAGFTLRCGQEYGHRKPLPLFPLAAKTMYVGLHSFITLFLFLGGAQLGVGQRLSDTAFKNFILIGN